MRKREEAKLERNILLASADYPRLALYRNEVGVSYRRSLKDAIEHAAICEGCRAAMFALMARSRIAHGLGVGSPDLVGCCAGRFIGIELKSLTGRLRDEQVEWHEAARAKGALVQVVKSVEDARALIELALWEAA